MNIHDAVLKIQVYWRLYICKKNLKEFNTFNLKLSAETKIFEDFQKIIINKKIINSGLKLIKSLNNFTAGTILNDTIYIKKNNLNTHYKNLDISANVNLASRNINTSEPSRNGNEFKLPLRLFL